MEYKPKRKIIPKRLLAVTGAAALLIGSGAAGIGKIYKKFQEKQRLKVYTTELQGDKKDEDRPINVFDEGADIVAQIPSEDISNYEVVLLETFEEGEQIYVALINQEEEIISGYVESRYINIEEKEEVEDITTADGFQDLAVVSKEGTWVTPDKRTYRHNGENTYLDVGTYVVAALPETASNNSDIWKKIIYSSGDSYKVGYVMEDNLVYADFDKYDDSIEMEVAVKKLRLRATPSTDAEIIDTMENGQKVIKILSEPSMEDGEYRWLYIMYKDEDGNIKFGWSAEVELDENGNEIKYLEYTNPQQTVVIQEEEEQEENTNIDQNDSNNLPRYVAKRVNTSSASGIDLNLRENPGTDSEIVAKIENGTILYISTENITNIQKVNNTNWVNITLDDGTIGWVSTSYLEDYDERVYSTKMIYNSFVEGPIEGYVGIDVSTKSITSEKLEKILQNQSVSDYQPPKHVGNISQLEENQKINFVYIRIDATTYGGFGFANDNVEDRKEVKKMADLCEKYQMPFGFYYYSQSLTDDQNTYAIDKGISKVNEVKAEEEYILDRMKEMNYKDYKYCVLPFAYDVEWYINDKEIEKSALFYKTWIQFKQDNPNAREEFTKMKVRAMNSLKERLGMDVILYTNQEMLSTVFDETITDQVQIWAVDPSNEHSNKLSNIPGLDTTNDIKCRQIALDTAVTLGTPNVYNGAVDWNIMNAEFFEECVLPIGYLEKMYDSERSVEYHEVDGEMVAYAVPTHEEDNER